MQQAAMQQCNEQVWALLLGKAWQRLDQRVVCRLMCCSNSMAQLVHSTCAGRLPVTIQRSWLRPPPPSGLPADRGGLEGLLSEQQQQACAQGQWLARNCRLLSELCVCLHDTDESLLAEGLLLAAAVAAAAADGTAGPAAADGTADGTTPSGAAAAGQLVLPVSAPGAVAALPLQSLTLRGTTNGSLLLALAGSQQLTKLQMCMGLETAAAPEVQEALASLVGLQDLDFSESSCRGRHQFQWFDTKATTAAAAAQSAFEQLAPALQPLTRLTRLELETIQFRGSCVQLLPPSLRSLQLGSDFAAGVYVVPAREALDLAHLTALTNLVIEDLQESDVLPGSLVKLRAPKCVSLQPALGLQQLQELKLESIPPGPELAQLGELCPALEAVSMVISCHEMDFTARCKALKNAAPHLPSFPLTKLELWTVPIQSWLLEPLSQCSSLTTLHLHKPDIKVRLDLLGAALQKLESLQHLWIVRPQRSGAALKNPPSDVPMVALPPGVKASLPHRALLAGIARMPSLRALTTSRFSLEEAAHELVVATQLEELSVCECYVEGTAAAAQLESVLGAAGVYVAIAG
jgi:hypothetical protein